MSFWEDKNILVTGGAGFLGSFVVEKLIKEKGVSPDAIRIPRSNVLDLTKQENCVRAVKDVDIVIHVAARGGGIDYNRRYPGKLFYDNISMNTNLMEAARVENVEKFIGIGTVCSYPKYTSIPFKEDNLWNGYPEETNAAYGLAKKMLLIQSQSYREQYNFNSINLLLVNLYGPRDDFSDLDSHVIPAIIKKIVDANSENKKEITAWGTGSASREFLYVKDAATAIIMAAEKYNKSNPVNIGSGEEITIKELITVIAELVGFNGEIKWDTTKPDGQPRRCLDVSRAKAEFGFEANVDFRKGIKKTIEWYEKERNSNRKARI
jgi:GDP-L-fucose synthase